MAFDIAEVVGTGAGNSQLKYAVDVCYSLRTELRGNAKTKLATIEQRANLGDHGVDVSRAGRDGLLDFDPGYRAFLKRQLDPVFRNVLKLAGYGDIAEGADIAQRWPLIYRYLELNSKTFAKRSPTYATLPGGVTKSNEAGKNSGTIVGDSVIYRLTKDRYGNDLDGGHGASIVGRCVQDKTNGAKEFAEVFEWYYDKGRTIFDDPPVNERIRLTIPNNGGGILRLPSFHIGNAADGAPTSLGTAWVDDAGSYDTSYDLVSSPVYRPGHDEQADSSVPLALRFNGNTTLYQKITRSLRRDVPYLYGVVCYRESSCDRTATVSLGKYAGIAHDLGGGSHTDATWKLLVPTIDENLWLDNFAPVNGDPLKFQIAVTTGGGVPAGTPVFDSAFLIPGTFFNGAFIWQLPGATSHVLDDKITWSDTAPSSPGKIATIVLEAYDRIVPTDASPTVSDP